MARIESQPYPTGHREANISAFQRIGPYRFDYRVLQANFGNIEFKPQSVRRPIQAVEMPSKLEDIALIDANAFKRAIAIEETVVVDRDAGLCLRDELAV